MKLAVFGAKGLTGRLLTQLALDEDHDVVAFTRRPDLSSAGIRGAEPRGEGVAQAVVVRGVRGGHPGHVSVGAD
jgi:uncharacterized protein YbjT (DUF2867 family)